MAFSLGSLFSKFKPHLNPEDVKLPEPPTPKNPWVGRAVKGTIGGLGVGVGAGMGIHSLISNPTPPSPPSIYDADQYRTAAELMERLEKTANKEELPMNLMDRLEKTAKNEERHRSEEQTASEDIMDRLEKTANDMALIQAISEATDIPPEQIVELMQQHPDEFAELVQELQGSQEQGVPAPQSLAQDIGQGIGAGGEFGGHVGGTLGGIGGLVAGAAGGGSMLGRLARGAVGAGAGMLGGHLIGTALGLPVGGVVGAVNHFRKDNPREGAASVSNNPAGVDQTASELMDRLEKTANAPIVQANASVLQALSEATGVPPEQILKEIQQNNPSQQSLAQSIGQGMGEGAELGGNLGGAAGGIAGLISGASGGKSILGRITRGAVGAGAGLLGGSLTGTVLGLPIGGVVGAARHFTNGTEQTASELMDRLEKTANSENTIARLEKTLDAAMDVENASKESNKQDKEDEQGKKANEDVAGLRKAALELGGMLGKVKNFAADAIGHNYRQAKKTFDTANTEEAFHANAPKVGVSNYAQHLGNLENDMNRAKGDMQTALKQTAIGGGVAAAGIGTGAALHNMLSNHDKQAAEGAPEGLEGYDDLNPDNNTAGEKPAVAEGPAGQQGLEGYESSKPEGKDKEASENEEFMNGLYKEAAAHILNLDVPKTKAYVDPMNRIKF